MTFNLIFFTVTFAFNKVTKEEALHQQRIKKIFEENADKVNRFRPFM